jgi:hypothetical protein
MMHTQHTPPQSNQTTRVIASVLMMLGFWAAIVVPIYLLTDISIWLALLVPVATVLTLGMSDRRTLPRTNH